MSVLHHNGFIEPSRPHPLLSSSLSGNPKSKPSESFLGYLLSTVSTPSKNSRYPLWLARIGLGFSQVPLLRHLISETEEERQAWEAVRDSGSLQKVVWAALLKVLLPVEALSTAQAQEAQNLRKEWNEAYAWIGEEKREGLLNLAQQLMSLEGETFQERLERAILLLIDANF